MTSRDHFFYATSRYSLVMLMVPPLCGSLMSYTRFFVTSVFPLLWPITARSHHENEEGFLVVSPQVLAAVAVVCLSVQCDLIWRFVQMEWSG